MGPRRMGAKMRLEGTVKLKEKISETEFLFGSRDLIAGKELGLIEQNKEGDCLCIFGTVGIVYVKRIDIDKVTYNQMINTNDLLKNHKEIMNKYLEGKDGVSRNDYDTGHSDDDGDERNGGAWVDS